MLSVFWDTEGIVWWELRPRGETINADIYCEQLDAVHEALKVLRPHRQKIVFLHDNASHRQEDEGEAQYARLASASSPSLLSRSGTFRLQTLPLASQCSTWEGVRESNGSGGVRPTVLHF